jgi:hypothetical protein
VKRPGAKQMRRKRRRATKGRDGRSPKAAHIIALVEGLSAGLGSHDGVHLGRGIARLLADSFAQRRGSVPLWVQDLIAHYAGTERAS